MKRLIIVLALAVLACRPGWSLAQEAVATPTNGEAFLAAVRAGERAPYRDADHRLITGIKAQELEAQDDEKNRINSQAHADLTAGNYAEAEKGFIEAAQFAVWSWASAWSHNNAAFAIIKGFDKAGGASKEGLERARGYLEEAGRLLDAADACAVCLELRPKSANEISACRAKVAKNLEYCTLRLK
jgi:hypothetical protein